MDEWYGGFEKIASTEPIDTPRTDSVWDTYWPNWEDRARAIKMMSEQLERELAASEAEAERLRKQLATAHEELCHAGLREYGN